MWKSGVLREHNPKQLCKMILYLMGVNFALWGASEHKNLWRLGFNPKIEYSADSDGVPCLINSKDACSKTNQGGLRNKYNETCVIYCYKSDD